MAGKRSSFNKERIYEKEIRPLAESLSKACRRNNIPFFWAVCVKNGKEGAKYESDVLTPPAVDITLDDDRISRHLAIVQGFEVMRPDDGMGSEYLEYAPPEEDLGYIEFEDM